MNLIRIFTAFIALALALPTHAQNTRLNNALFTGTLNGTPSGGTLNLGSVSLTLPTASLQIGSNVQAYDADLAAIAALSTNSAGRSLLTLSAVPSGALVGTSDSQTLTAKTIDGASNTVTNVTHRALFEDQKATGANGDAVTAGGWRTVTLNTEVYDTASGFSVSGNVITVGAAGAGTKFVRAVVPLYGTSTARIRLRRTNNTATTLAVGSVIYSWNSNYVTASSELMKEVTLASGDTLELQVYTQTNGQIGYNSDSSTGEIAVFSRLEFFTR